MWISTPVTVFNTHIMFRNVLLLLALVVLVAESRRMKLVPKWRRIPGGLTRTAFGARGIWGVNKNDDIFHWRGGKWHHIKGKLVHISSGRHVWGVNRQDNIYRYLGGHRWKHIGGKLTNVSFASIIPLARAWPLPK